MARNSALVSSGHVPIVAGALARLFSLKTRVAQYLVTVFETHGLRVTVNLLQ